MAVVLGWTGPTAAEDMGPSYFRALLEREGVRGVVGRLFVAPPDLLTSLFQGIATGSAEWLDIYGRMRAGLLPTSPVTRQRDDKAAQALAVEPARVLAYFRDHPKFPADRICEMAPPADRVAAFVLQPRELLALVRREQRLATLAAPEVERQRLACLQATRAALLRQLRIYFVSFGAKDAKWRGDRPLNEAERRELEAAIAPARKDASLRARGDGSFPDGPFRVAKVPAVVLALCTGDEFGVANP